VKQAVLQLTAVPTVTVCSERVKTHTDWQSDEKSYKWNEGCI